MLLEDVKPVVSPRHGSKAVTDYIARWREHVAIWKTVMPLDKRVKCFDQLNAFAACTNFPSVGHIENNFLRTGPRPMLQSLRCKQRPQILFIITGKTHRESKVKHRTALGNVFKGASSMLFDS